MKEFAEDTRPRDENMWLYVNLLVAVSRLTLSRLLQLLLPSYCPRLLLPFASAPPRRPRRVPPFLCAVSRVCMAPVLAAK
jgi:hypothetical protein